jgi:hypothetical protein
MKKHEIAKLSANGHISMVNVIRGTSDKSLIVRCIVLYMESIVDSTLRQGTYKRDE